MDVVEYINVKDFIPVVYTPADDYASLALLSMVSLLKNTNKNIDVVVLYSKLNEQSFEMFNFVKSFPNSSISMENMV